MSVIILILRLPKKLIVLLLLALLGIAVSACGHDPQRDAWTGDAGTGDAWTGDARTGDAQAGDTQIGDVQIGDARNVTISWGQPSSGDPVLAYQLYQDDLLLCETFDPNARTITCPIELAGSSVFKMVAVYDDDLRRQL